MDPSISRNHEAIPDTSTSSGQAGAKTRNDHEMPSPPIKAMGMGHSPRSSSTDTTLSSNGDDEKMRALGPPPLSFSPWDKKISIIICTLGLLFFDLVLPCILYYAISYNTDLNMEVVLGISCASLGLGELMELPLRGYRLVKHRSEYAPLGQTAKWGFDFLFWWYAVATVIGIVPYVISTSFDSPILWLFLMTPGFLVGFAIATTVVSMIPFSLPCRVSSDAKGQTCKPFVYYVIEDFVAVDAGQKRGYREELRARWNASPIFRRLIWDINLWWTIGGVVFIGALAGMTWGLDFDTAYGLSFGLLFVWIGLWALGSRLWVIRALPKEREWFARTEG
ncbi:uncharacterized protein PAC_06207 [Phialocephala subalpina]|uniref:Uncharacterized protein n=1 Tax=Phialocephala subalpina TaxID=576137 RepID=A0A1L7WU93_9HELO|nr:uncharacterized protein PAC_06207 [Phialocephala subalpina]